MWRIQLFGGIKAVSGATVVSHFETRRAACLLAYLAMHRDRAHSREVLAEMLWPDEDTDATRDRLRQALAAIRRALEPDGAINGSVLKADRFEVGLAMDRFETDVASFAFKVKAAERTTDPLEQLTLLREAAENYRGELMPGFYDSWVIAERGRLAETYYDCLTRTMVMLEEQGDVQQALQCARRAIGADPLREEGYISLIRMYAAEGRLSDAIRHFREFERVLREQLGVAPSEAARELISRISAGSSPRPAEAKHAPCRTYVSSLEPDGGAVPLGSQYYITRPTDGEFQQAVLRSDSIVLVKGARQIGKTSLLARGLQEAREHGARVILTDIQKLTDPQLDSAEALFYYLAGSIADQLQLDAPIEKSWDTARGWNVNFERFMRREVLAPEGGPIIWGLDEVDRLFAYSYSKSVFGLFRAWHNERSLDPDGPWSRLTLAIAYATEAHLFISDLNQSPFNVGTRLTLQDFTPDEVAELNRRYGSVLNGDRALNRFVDLVGGHPYLVRKGLHAIADSGPDLEQFFAKPSREDGLFGDHLLRLYRSLVQDESLCDAMREILRGRRCPTQESYYRLQSAGLISGPSDMEAKPRCKLYWDFLSRRLL